MSGAGVGACGVAVYSRMGRGLGGRGATRVIAAVSAVAGAGGHRWVGISGRGLWGCLNREGDPFGPALRTVNNQSGEAARGIVPFRDSVRESSGFAVSEADDEGGRDLPTWGQSSADSVDGRGAGRRGAREDLTTNGSSSSVWSEGGTTGSALGEEEEDAAGDLVLAASSSLRLSQTLAGCGFWGGSGFWRMLFLARSA